jgi:tRNA1(Val) A37 N6-methylase TrmN6
MLFDLESIEQHFQIPLERKLKYGEVNTDFSLIQSIFSLLPDSVFCNPSLRWLDVGAGYGYFSMVLFNKLFVGLEHVIADPFERAKHILTYSITMIEINPIFKKELLKYFSKDANIIIKDFLSFSSEEKYDMLIGNVPYNTNGLVKTPTNQKSNKKQDGTTIWPHFIRKMISHVKENGYLCVIIPSLWMRPDKAKMHQFLCNYKLHKCVTLTNTETNKWFKGNAQTPTCYFTLQKMKTDYKVSLLDTMNQTYVDYDYKNIETPIPLTHITIINKLQHFVNKCGYIDVIKTNTPPKHSSIQPIENKEHPFKNIKTCMLHGFQPSLVFEYSNKELAFANEKKLVLAHKMYGFPYYDSNGSYGISRRDNYVIIKKTHEEFLLLQSFLSSPLALFVYEATRYRMKYLEKEAFLFLPNVCNLENFTIENMFNVFDINEKERTFIYNFHKNYGRFKN